MQLIIALGVILWLLALVLLCSRRDVEIHRKLTWVVTVLVLNVLGALIYFAFGPKRVLPASAPIDPDAEPIQPLGESWNPILGANRLPPGQGLNPNEAKR
jgi:glucan phosphoethanolaminetransferase (alkaline phosphatase superfamily)